MFHNINTKIIRSFVLRNGRITKNQQKSLDTHWLTIGIDYKKENIDFKDIFKRKAPTILEIGFGMGLSLVNMAYNNQKNNFLGIEVYKSGIGSCINYVISTGIRNLRLICHDAIEVLENMIYDNSLTVIQLFFPDPWHKKKHNKRRIIQSFFLILVLKKLKRGGIFHIVTDSQDYRKHILKIIGSFLSFKNISEELTSKKIITSRPKTKFEIRGMNLGNKINELIFKKLF